MSWPQVVDRLKNGYEVTLHPKGNSMTPRISSGQEITITPIAGRELEVGMVVLAKVRGRHYLHLISAIDHNGRIQISNNHGWVNGWTDQSRVYGIVDV